MNANVTKLLAIAAFASLAACTAETADTNEPSQIQIDEQGNVVGEDGKAVEGQRGCAALNSLGTACWCW